MRLVEEGVEQLAAYATVPIRFEVCSRLDVAALRLPGAQFVEVPIVPWLKDYYAFEAERPTALPSRFNMENWLIVGAFRGEQRLGGMIVARDTPDCDMLEGRTDLVVPFDVRVLPEARGKGVGRRSSRMS